MSHELLLTVYAILKAAAFSLLGLYALWIFYLAIMNLKRANDAGTLRPWALRFGLPVLLIGYCIDILVNFSIVTVMFLELPKELVVTARLSRYISGDYGWRTTLAKWFCGTLLDSFDPSGCHCQQEAATGTTTTAATSTATTS